MALEMLNARSIPQCPLVKNIMQRTRNQSRKYYKTTYAFREKDLKWPWNTVWDSLLSITNNAQGIQYQSFFPILYCWNSFPMIRVKQTTFKFKHWFMLSFKISSKSVIYLVVIKLAKLHYNRNTKSIHYFHLKLSWTNMYIR